MPLSNTKPDTPRALPFYFLLTSILLLCFQTQFHASIGTDTKLQQDLLQQYYKTKEKEIINENSKSLEDRLDTNTKHPDLTSEEYLSAAVLLLSLCTENKNLTPYDLHKNMVKRPNDFNREVITINTEFMMNIAPESQYSLIEFLRLMHIKRHKPQPWITKQRLRDAACSVGLGLVLNVCLLAGVLSILKTVHPKFDKNSIDLKKASKKIDHDL